MSTIQRQDINTLQPDLVEVNTNNNFIMIKQDLNGGFLFSMILLIIVLTAAYCVCISFINDK